MAVSVNAATANAASIDFADYQLRTRQQRCGYNSWLDAVYHSTAELTTRALAAWTYVEALRAWHDAEVPSPDVVSCE